MSNELATLRVWHEPSGRAVIAISGEIDMSNADWLSEQIEAQINGSTHVVLDMSAVQYLDTRGVRLVVGLADREQIKLVVVAPPGSVTLAILVITGLEKVMDVRASVPGEVEDSLV